MVVEGHKGDDGAAVGALDLVEADTRARAHTHLATERDSGAHSDRHPELIS